MAGDQAWIGSGSEQRTFFQQFFFSQQGKAELQFEIGTGRNPALSATGCAIKSDLPAEPDAPDLAKTTKGDRECHTKSQPWSITSG